MAAADEDATTSSRLQTRRTWSPDDQTHPASGDVTGTIHGLTDYWVVKLDSAGNIVWQKLLGGSGNELAWSVQQTGDGGYIVAGWSASSASGDVTGTNHGGNDYLGSQARYHRKHRVAKVAGRQRQ